MMQKQIQRAIFVACLCCTTVATAGTLKEQSGGYPLFIVYRGRLLDEGETTAISARYGASVLRASAILRLISIEPPPQGHSSPSALLQEAQDHFYQGDYAACDAAIERLDTLIETYPALWRDDPKLRQHLFYGALYQALTARESGDQARVEERLHYAAARFSEFEAPAADFPPWLIQLHMQIRKNAPSPIRYPVRIAAPADCRLFADGLETAVTDNTATLTENTQMLHVVCGTAKSLVTRHNATRPHETWSPLFDTGNRIRRIGDDVVIHDTADIQVDIDSLVPQLAAPGHWPRVILVISAPDSIHVEIRDGKSGAILHRVFPFATGEGVTSGEFSASATTSLAFETHPPPPPTPSTFHPWFKNPLAFSLIGTGIAALATGLALGLSQGKNSPSEPAALGLQIIGGAATLTGGGLLFFPRPVQPARDE